MYKLQPDSAFTTFCLSVMDNLRHFVIVPLRILVSLIQGFFLTTNPLVLYQQFF